MNSPLPVEQLHGYLLWLVHAAMFFTLILLTRAICRILRLGMQMRAAAGVRSDEMRKDPIPDLLNPAGMEAPTPASQSGAGLRLDGPCRPHLATGCGPAHPGGTDFGQAACSEAGSIPPRRLRIETGSTRRRGDFRTG